MKNNFLNGLKNEANYTETENGAVALSSTMNKCLDAFGSLGAMKNSDSNQIIQTFSNSFYTDRALTMRMLFYIRDIRGGQGMRRVFRIIVKWLAENHSEYVINNLDNFLYFGRGDDIICLLDSTKEVKNAVISWAKNQLNKDLEAVKSGTEVSLLAKWMPSENTSSQETKKAAREFIKGFSMTPSGYRKMLSKLRKALKVVERDMSSKNWENINYSAVPAKASMLYSDAFFAHDENRYTQFIQDISNGDAKINAASLFPVDIVSKILPNYNDYYSEKRSLNKKNILLLDAMWNALPNYFEGREETGICVVDTSGSMMGEPLNVAVSLGIYCADKCKGPFEKHFITFSSKPNLQEIVGERITDKVNSVQNADWNMNTNLEAVFNLILETGKKYGCSDDEMPKKLYIISDMQFDDATSEGYCKNKRTFMEMMEDKYTEAGYTMPSIVYWNVRASDCGMFQTTFQGKDCCMVSGYSSSLFEAIIRGTTYEEVEVVDSNGNKVIKKTEKLDPINVMLTTLNAERYSRVWAG